MSVLLAWEKGSAGVAIRVEMLLREGERGENHSYVDLFLLARTVTQVWVDVVGSTRDASFLLKKVQGHQVKY